MKRTLAVALCLSGCAQPQDGEATWLMGASYEWVGFNHRLAHWTAKTEDEKATMAVIGGTSTTGVPPKLADTCDPDTCTEYPFNDSTKSTLYWGVVKSSDAHFVRGSVSLEVGAEGASGEVTVTFEDPGPFAERPTEPRFVLTGFSFDSDVPLATESCYDPSFGWLPRRLAIELGTPVEGEERTWTVPVTANFESGPSEEEVRECLDAVVGLARARIEVDVLGVISLGASEVNEIEYRRAYDWTGSASKPGEQPPPDDNDRQAQVELENARLQGWSRIDFRFHEEVERGAYLRSLQFQTGSENLPFLATGHATNYSPLTQLSAFDYHFLGTLVSVEVGEDVVYGAETEVIPAELDADGRPALHSFPLKTVY